MKKILLLFLFFILCFDMNSQDYFKARGNRDEIYYKGYMIDLSQFQNFCTQNTLAIYPSLFHDRATEKYYVVTNDRKQKICMFLISKNIIDLSASITYILKDHEIFSHIDNGKLLIWDTFHKEYDYYIWDPKTRSGVSFFVTVPNGVFKSPIAFRQNRIFFREGYYNIEKETFIPYPTKLTKIIVDDDGDRIVGLDEDNYITLVDLNTKLINNTKIKRKQKYNTMINNTGMFYLNKDELYFSKSKFSFTYFIGLLFFLEGNEERQWYKMNLITKEIQKIENQPYDVIDML